MGCFRYTIREISGNHDHNLIFRVTPKGDVRLFDGGPLPAAAFSVDSSSQNGDNSRGSDGMENDNPRRNEKGEWVMADGIRIEISEGYKTESGKDINAANPMAFIVRPNGSMDFGEITADVSAQAGKEIPQGKIRLRVGNAHEGLVHAKKHEANAVANGYNNIEDAIAYVTENYDLIYRRDTGKRPSYTLIKLRDNSNTNNMTASMYLDLYPDGQGNDYVIIGAMPKRDRSLQKSIKKEHLIYRSPAVDAATIPSDGAVSAPSSSEAGAKRDGLPTSDKSNASSGDTIPQSQQKGNITARNSP